MNKTVLLVDYENIGKVDLGAISADTTVIFFVGTTQKSVPTELLKSAVKLRERFVQVDIEGQGKNALDFHIAFYLGEIFARHPETSCAILSKDKGFDALIKHLTGRQLAVRRIEQIGVAQAPIKPKSITRKAATPTPNPILTNALEWLEKMQKNKRPRKRNGLVAHLHSHCGKKIPETEIQAFVDWLIADKKLGEENGAITYRF